MWTEFALINSKRPSSVWLLLQEWFWVMNCQDCVIFLHPGTWDPINIPTEEYLFSSWIIFI